MVACDWDPRLGKGENRKFQHAINLKTGISVFNTLEKATEFDLMLT